jgi:hypothetical protein
MHGSILHFAFALTISILAAFWVGYKIGYAGGQHDEWNSSNLEN